MRAASHAGEKLDKTGVGSIAETSDIRSMSQTRNVATVDETGAASEVGVPDPSVLNVNESLDEPPVNVPGRALYGGAALNTSYAEKRPWRGGPGKA